MAWADLIQYAIYFAVLLLCVKPLGGYMANVYEGKTPSAAGMLRSFEYRLYRWCGVHPDEEMDWKQYATAVLLVSMVGFVFLYLLQRVQGIALLNPAKLGAVSPDSSFNTAVSFITNTNWQAYGGETTMSYLTQMLGLTVQNFLSAATGMAILIALIRGIVRRQSATIGNFWVDFTRSTIYILMPLSIGMSLLLVSQGVVQSFSPYVTANLIQPLHDSHGAAITQQTIAIGPAASQVAIKQLGTNGGGFFNVNSAHPLENPTPLSNFAEVLAILLIPAALCYTFGLMVNDKRQGWSLLATMMIVLVAGLAICAWSESREVPGLSKLGVATNSADAPAGNMEGKEQRIGVANSVLWAVNTTAASNGSVNAMHDSFTPLGGLVPMVMMQLGEVIFGGVGSGLYGLLVFVVIAVFIAGLMVGRTPEYLGKKIQAGEMKMASIAVLVPCMCVLVGTAVAVMTPSVASSLSNPLPHGFSQVLYAFSSASNNNGSAFAGLNGNTVVLNVLLGLCMLLGRFGVAIPVLALAGSLAAKKHVPTTEGTLPTHQPLFVFLLIAIVLIVGALTFFPSLALGPIVEHLQLFAKAANP